MDFWNCRVRRFMFAPQNTFIPLIHRRIQNVAGRTLVGLRFWNQVSTLRILRSHL
jgi:hypothetical protein